MNEIKIYNNSELGSVRTIEKDGQVWFVGKDVAEILGYAKPENAVSNHIDDEDKTTTYPRRKALSLFRMTVICWMPVRITSSC